MLLLLSQQAFILIFRWRWCSNHTSEVVTFHPELSKAPPQRKNMCKKRCNDKMECEKLQDQWWRKRQCERHSPGNQCKDWLLSHLPSVLSVLWSIRVWCISMVSGGTAVLCLVHAQSTALPEPPLPSEAICWTDWAFYLYLNLCHKPLNLVIINKQNSKEKKTTKCFRVTGSIVIIENTTIAMKGAHIKNSTH